MVVRKTVRSPSGVDSPRKRTVSARLPTQTRVKIATSWCLIISTGIGISIIIVVSSFAIK